MADPGGSTGKSPTYGPNNPNANQPGYDANGRPLQSQGPWPGWVVNPNTGGLIPPGTAPTAGGGIPQGTFFKVGDSIWLWDGKGVRKATVAESKNFDGPVIDINGANGPTSENPSGVGDASSGSGSDSALGDATLSSEEKRAADALAEKYYNDGLDYDSARRQALATLIANRNSNSVNLAQTSGDIAAKAAQFAANPRDAASDLMYRNAIGGSTPYGSTGNAAFGNLQSGLANKFQELFGGVAGDLSRARDFISAPPPAEYYDNATRAKLGLGPAAADATAPAPASAPVAAPALNQTNATAGALQFLQAMQDPNTARNFREYVTGANSPQPYAHGGTINVDALHHALHRRTSTGNIAGNGGFGSTPGFSQGGSINFSPADAALINSRMLNRVEGHHFPHAPIAWPTPGSVRPPAFPVGKPPMGGYIGDPTISPVGPSIGTGFPVTQPSPIRMFASGGEVNSVPAPSLMNGYRPPSSEGGTSMNIHEPSVLIGIHSGHAYATMSENAPEQLIIKPLPSVQKAQREQETKAKQGQKQFVQGAQPYADGGTVNSIPQVTDFITQLRQQLSMLGGQGGGTGGNVGGGGLPDPRMLAGAPANALSEDPDLAAYTQAGYSSLGISPDTLAATIAKFTPRGIMGNLPRTSFA